MDEAAAEATLVAAAAVSPAPEGTTLGDAVGLGVCDAGSDAGVRSLGPAHGDSLAGFSEGVSHGDEVPVELELGVGMVPEDDRELGALSAADVDAGPDVNVGADVVSEVRPADMPVPEVPVADMPVSDVPPPPSERVAAPPGAATVRSLWQ